MDRLGVYCRVSSEGQTEGTSLTTQEELGLKKGQELGLETVIFNEGAKSSHSEDITKRPVLVSLLNQINDGKITHVYVFNTDRLGRNETVWSTIKLHLLRNGVKLYTNTGEYDLEDPMSKMLLNLMSSVAVYDNELRTERFRVGKLESLKTRQGWKGGPPPFGYKLENKKLVKNENESKYLDDIYTLYSEGKSLEDIRKHLMNNGVRTRRGNVVWNSVSIRKILENTHYSGYYTYTDSKTEETITIECERLLPQELIDKVNTLKEKRSYNQKSNTQRTHSSVTTQTLLGEILYCRSCGTKCGSKVRMSNKNQKPYYYCLLKYQPDKTQLSSQRTCSSSKNSSIENLDKFVWEKVVDTLSESSLFKERIKNQLFQNNDNMTPDEIRKIGRKMKGIKKELETINSSITSLTSTSLITGIKHDEVIKELQLTKVERTNQLKELEQTILDNQKNKKWLDWVSEFGNQIDQLKNSELPKPERKKFLDGIVSKVSIEGKDKNTHYVEIEFTLPCVGDEMVWRNPSKKSLGYNIREGSTTLLTEMVVERSYTKHKQKNPM